MKGTITGTGQQIVRNPTAASLMADIRSGDRGLRHRAIVQSTLIGTPLIADLGRALGGDPAIVRAAQEALRRVVHHAARPRAASERRTACRELLKLTDPALPRAARVEALSLLGCVGNADVVPGLAGLLKDPDVAEEARMALARLPGSAARRALAATRTGFANEPAGRYPAASSRS